MNSHMEWPPSREGDAIPDLPSVPGQDPPGPCGTSKSQTRRTLASP